jgi:hypothetical protein
MPPRAVVERVASNPGRQSARYYGSSSSLAVDQMETFKSGSFNISKSNAGDTLIRDLLLDLKRLVGNMSC